MALGFFLWLVLRIDFGLFSGKGLSTILDILACLLVFFCPFPICYKCLTNKFIVLCLTFFDQCFWLARFNFIVTFYNHVLYPSIHWYYYILYMFYLSLWSFLFITIWLINSKQIFIIASLNVSNSHVDLLVMAMVGYSTILDMLTKMPSNPYFSMVSGYFLALAADVRECYQKNLSIPILACVTYPS